MDEDRVEEAQHAVYNILGWWEAMGQGRRDWLIGAFENYWKETQTPKWN